MREERPYWQVDCPIAESDLRNRRIKRGDFLIVYLKYCGSEQNREGTSRFMIGFLESILPESILLAPGWDDKKGRPIYEPSTPSRTGKGIRINYASMHSLHRPGHHSFPL